MNGSTETTIAKVARRKYKDKVMVRKDPRGRPYYWLFGERLSSFPPGTDAEAVLVKREISITPLVLNMSGPMSEELQGLRDRVQAQLEAEKQEFPSKPK
jgi:5'-nucleotidase